ncbi:hypothetical protein D3C73_1182230 [compost metagenome]
MFSPDGQDVVVEGGTIINTLLQDGSGAKNLRLEGVKIVNNTIMKGTNLMLKDTQFLGSYTQQYVGGTKTIMNCHFSGTVTLSGAAAGYGSKLHYCVLLSTLTVDVNNTSELRYCSIDGAASGDATSKLIKCYAPAGTGSLTIF